MNEQPGSGPPLPGGILVVAPHMDDETLGCGMLLAEQALHRREAHVLFATDGARSPEPPEGPVDGIPAIREAEARAALEQLGISADCISCAGLPDGAVAANAARLRETVVSLAGALRPAFVLVPFRYDRHPDHIAVNRIVVDAALGGDLGDAQIVEYFVYTQWRLLASGDVRDYLPPRDVLRVQSPVAAERKRLALACYRSQTTRFFAWQRRPILTDALIRRVCAEPETFLYRRPGRDGRLGLARGRYWVPIAHRLEPALKRLKDRVIEWRP